MGLWEPLIIHRLIDCKDWVSQDGHFTSNNSNQLFFFSCALENGLYQRAYILTVNVYCKFTEIYVVSAADDWKQAEAKKPHYKVQTQTPGHRTLREEQGTSLITDISFGINQWVR